MPKNQVAKMSKKKGEMEADQQVLEDIINSDKAKYSQTEMSAHLKVFARRILAQEAIIRKQGAEIKDFKSQQTVKKAGNCSAFDTLLTRNVPHILEKIFLSLDYKSFITCRRVSKTWNELLTSESFQKKEKSVYIMELRDCIKRALEKPLVQGDTWYLCDVRWFAKLRKYLRLKDPFNPYYDGNGGDDQSDVRDPSAHPGHIDLSGLFQDGDKSAELREHMFTFMDYIIMPESAWDMLVEVFGLTEGQNPVARKVIKSGIFVTHNKIEVYLMELKLAEKTNMNDIRCAKFSRNDTLGGLVESGIEIVTLICRGRKW